MAREIQDNTSATSLDDTSEGSVVTTRTEYSRVYVESVARFDSTGIGGQFGNVFGGDVQLRCTVYGVRCTMREDGGWGRQNYVYLVLYALFLYSTCSNIRVYRSLDKNTDGFFFTSHHDTNPKRRKAKGACGSIDLLVKAKNSTEMAWSHVSFCTDTLYRRGA